MGLSSLIRRAAVAAVAVAAAGIGLPTPAHADSAPTQLNASDMMLLNGVRQAGLWEIPAGQMAAQKGASPTVRMVGQMIADQHVKLDQLDVNAANKLGATIPSTPTTQQQGWLNQLQNLKGPQFDLTFVALLRNAHGKIFPVIGAVRAATRDPVIRDLADQANIFVMHHMQMLESTGLVRFGQLPPAALPPAQDLTAFGQARANTGLAPPVSPTILWLLVAGALAVGSFTVVRITRRSAGLNGARRV